MKREELAARLLATFLTELEEHVGGMNRDLLALETAPEDEEALRSLFRAAHSLKGAAHAAGVPAIERLCHALESLLAEIREGRVKPAGSEFAFLFASVDLLDEAGGRLRSGERLPEGTLLARARAAVAPAASKPHGDAGAPVPPPEPQSPLVPPADEVADVPPSQPLPQGVRVEADQLNALVALAGELRTTVERVAAQARELDALYERTRRPHDAGDRVSTAHAAELGRMAAGWRREARALDQITSRLGRQTARLRMRPFADAAESLPRAVRDLAQGAGKEVRFIMRGTAVEADREVWVTAREALLHVLRNAVDHGLETPDAREAAGKPREGQLTLTVEATSERIVLTVEDDGRGVDLDAVRARLAAEGGVAPTDQEELVGAVFRSGFSTMRRATLTSGRGVGLDSVRSSLQRIGGRVTLRTEEGRGTTVTLTLPASLTGSRAVLVRVGAQVFAVPTSGVEQLRRLDRREDISLVDGREVYQAEDGPVPLRALGPLFGLPAPVDVNGHLQVVAVSDGQRRLGLVVDECLDEQELLIRRLEHSPGSLPALTGAAILGDGRVAPMLNLAAAIEQASGAPADGLREAGSGWERTRRRRILVVDDSITTRVLEQSILEAAGYEVFTAANGEEGWNLVRNQPCDLVVSDVEMPRLDGFELCANIRASATLNELPVVLVTARESPADRTRGLEAGASAYLPKSSFDQEQLLDVIRDLLGEAS